MGLVDLILRDKLAIDRTHLANERTFLSYFRTAMVFLSSGVAIVKFELLAPIKGLGWILIALSPLIFLIGVWRLIRVRRRIQRYYREE